MLFFWRFVLFQCLLHFLRVRLQHVFWRFRWLFVRYYNFVIYNLKIPINCWEVLDAIIQWVIVLGYLYLFLREYFLDLRYLVIVLEVFFYPFVAIFVPFLMQPYWSDHILRYKTYNVLFFGNWLRAWFGRFEGSRRLLNWRLHHLRNTVFILMFIVFLIIFFDGWKRVFLQQILV